MNASKPAHLSIRHFLLWATLGAVVLLSSVLSLSCLVSGSVSTRPQKRSVASRVETQNNQETRDIVRSEKRIALVIGNSAYRQAGASLRGNPIHDARAMKEKLKKAGFHVSTLLDARQKEMEASISKFIRRLGGEGTVGLFYFAGHGFQANGHNYLMGIDAVFDTEFEIAQQIDVSKLARTMGRENGKGINLVFLDACRVVAQTTLRTNGFAEIASPYPGTLISFAAGYGQSAKNGKRDGNGVYTEALLNNLLVPDIDVSEMAHRVAAQVVARTNAEQTPVLHDALTSQFYFNRLHKGKKGRALAGAQSPATVLWKQTFENVADRNGWSVEGGVWGMGIPTAEDGPKAYKGHRLAGTVLNGDYPADNLSRLVSPVFVVPAKKENPRIRYWYWSDLLHAKGQIQIKTKDNPRWRSFQAENITGGNGRWTQRILDLRAFERKSVQIGFRISTDKVQATAPGWYIDDVSLEVGPMLFRKVENFDIASGVGDWSIEGGVWEIGRPQGASAPAARSGKQLASTGLSGRYPPNTRARLVSPVFRVPSSSESPRLTYWYWYDLVDDRAQLQIRTGNGAWKDVYGEKLTGSGESWYQRIIQLGKYERQRIQIGFLFRSNDNGAIGAGWYIEDVAFETGEM